MPATGNSSRPTKDSQSLVTVRDLSAFHSAAKEKSRRTRKTVSFIVDVSPRGKTKIRPVEPGLMNVTLPAPAQPNNDLQDALSAARERGHARVAELLSGDDMLTADQFAALIGTSRVTVNARRQAHQVLALEGAKRGFRFPRWQIGADGKPFAAFPALFARLGGSPWAVYRFLVQRHPELNGLTGRDALACGRSAEALEVAESVVRAMS